MEIEVRVLGPVEVAQVTGGSERIHGIGARLLLALIVDRGRIVDDGDLIDRLWPEGAPQHAIASVRNQVAKLRRAFGSAIIDRDRMGYRLGACGLDLDRFQAAVQAAREPGQAPAVAASTIDRALALVRGRPLHEVADEVWAMSTAAAIAEQLASAEELWAALSLEDRPSVVDVHRLRRAATAQPHREVRWRQLVLALSSAGHRTEALRAASEARRALAEFGMMPCLELVEAERQLIGSENTPPAGARRVPARRDPMVGRDAALAEVLRPGRVVWVEGGPGTGKTRLLAEVADRTNSATSVLLYVACPRGTLNGGGGLVSSLLSATADVVPSAAAPMVDALGWPHSHGDCEAWRASVADGIVTRLREASTERDLTVALDDVQSLDAAAVATLQDVMCRTIADVHWIVASRPLDRHPTTSGLRAELERIDLVRQVRLDNLTADDVRQLIAEMSPELAPECCDELADEIMSSTGGHPLFAAELIRHQTGETAHGARRLDAILAGSLAALAPDERHLIELLAMLEGACPVVVLADACGCAPLAVLERAERLVAEGLAAPVGPGGLDLRYEVVRRAIERQLPPAVEMTRRQSLVRALAKDERCIVALADQLLRSGHLLQDHQISQRDEAVASAIDQMLLELNYPTAAQLAERYLDAVSGPPTGSIALRAHLKAAMALNAVGNIGRGQSILTQLREQARAAGDHGVLADAILATGPLTTARRTHDDVLCDVENLLTQLPASEGVRRVQLACWAAHQLLLRGDRLRAEHLLDTADGEAYGGWQLQGLIQAVRAQADTLVGSEPEAARRSLSELRRWATSRSDLTAEAAACLLGAREAWADGTLEDVTEVRRDIAAVATRMPRPDLRWWPYAMDAAIELAAGRSRRARSAIDAAARVGRELKVEAAAPTARAQELLLLFADGELGSMSESLAHLASQSDAPISTVAAYGLACAEAGDTEAALKTAARLAAAPNLLVRAGASWPLVAMCASTICFAAAETALARSLWRPLTRHRGTGLALHSVGYFGTVDSCLGLLAVTLGHPACGEALLESAREQERRRGALAWERRVDTHLRTVRWRRHESNGGRRERT